MEIDFLRHYRFCKQVLGALRRDYGDTFLPLQERAIQEGRLLDGKRLIVCAPTSSGKTMLAELAFLAHEAKMKNTVLLVPTKALANQRYEELKQRYGPLGYDIVLSTRDHPQDDGRIVKGRFHLAVVIYEKMQMLMAMNPAWLNQLGSCVVDEFHYIYHNQRGPDLELLLSRLARLQTLQIIGLSSVVAHLSVAEWLKAELLVEKSRPVELRQGVLCGGRFTYSGFNSNERGVERLAIEHSEDEHWLMLDAARYFAGLNERSLLFWPRREQCYWAAKQLARHLEQDETIDLQPLLELEPGAIRELLLEIVPRGVAVHTSDLTRTERTVVERYCKRGEARVVCATSTLVEGLNFPIDNVLTTPMMYTQSSHGDAARGAPVPALISPSQLCNMTGRAGRKGLKNFGRGMIVTHSTANVEALMQQYNAHHPDLNEPCLYKQPLNQTLLKIIGSQNGINKEGIIDQLEQTLTGRCDLWPEDIKKQVDTILLKLRDQSLIVDDFGAYFTTTLGELVYKNGLSERSAQRIQGFIHEIHEDTHPLNLLLFINLLEEMQETFISLGHDDIATHRWTREIELAFDNQHLEWCPSLQKLFTNKPALRNEHHRAFKKTLLLYHWLEGVDTPTLEQCFYTYAGTLGRIASEAGWMLSCLHDAAVSYALPPAVIAKLQSLQNHVSAGVPMDYEHWLVEVKRGRISRRQALLLIQRGIYSPHEIHTEDEALLREYCPALPEHYFDSKHSLDYERAALPKQNTNDANSGLPEIMLNPARPDQMTINHQEITLTPLQRELLRTLARSPRQCIDYDTLIESIWPESHGDRKQLSQRKCEIQKKIEAQLGKKAPRLVETVPGRGMMLQARVIPWQESAA